MCKTIGKLLAVLVRVSLLPPTVRKKLWMGGGWLSIVCALVYLRAIEPIFTVENLLV